MLLVLRLYILFLLHFDKILCLAAAIIVTILIARYIEYKKSAYYQVTKHPYLFVRSDLGRYGEYHTYKRLKRFEAEGAKYLFNVYIPTGNGETTEIDVLMLSPKGIFVFESKNYSGWIFGNEYQKNWCQTLPAGRGRSHKEHFYNPVMQNRSHIKHLKAFLGEGIPMHSIIAFSERCTLKKVEINSPDIHVVNRNQITSVVATIYDLTPSVLSDSNISDIYNKIYPLSQVDTATKAQHIANIHDKNQPPSLVQTPPVTPVNTQPKTEEPTQPPAKAVENQAVTPKSTDSVDPKSLKCPKCGGTLILRTATRGANAGNQFYGCSNFPKCKYIQSISTEM